MTLVIYIPFSILKMCLKMDTYGQLVEKVYNFGHRSLDSRHEKGRANIDN